MISTLRSELAAQQQQLLLLRDDLGVASLPLLVVRCAKDLL